MSKEFVMNNFDSIIQGSLSIAQSIAIERKNSELTPIHLLYGLVKNPQTYTSRVFSNELGVIESELNKIPFSNNEVQIDQIRPSGALSKWLTQASAESTQKGHSEVREPDLVKFLPGVFPHLDLPYEKLGTAEGETEVPSFLVNLIG